MHRLLVSSTIVGLITISGLAFTLIAIVIARSPYTHGNLSPEGYHRTEIALRRVRTNPSKGSASLTPGLPRRETRYRTGAPSSSGYGCASCHGLKGQGEAVGKDLSGDSALKISSKVRDGPKTMPSFDTSVLPDSDLQKTHCLPAVDIGRKLEGLIS